MNNMVFQDVYPRQTWDSHDFQRGGINQNERFGGFLFPFLTGALIGGPLFNRRPYPMPYPIYQPYPQFIPYPPYPYPYYPPRQPRWY